MFELGDASAECDPASMTVSNDVPIPAISLHARRDILVAAWEEDAVLDLLRFMAGQHGKTDRHWLGAIASKAERGTLTAYRYGAQAGVHEPVDVTQVASGTIGSDRKDTVFLSRTDKTLFEIRSLPPPSADRSQWIIGLWETRRERCDP